MMKGLDVLGCPTVISTVHDPSIRAPRLAQVLRWAAAGDISPYISHATPLEQYQAAMRARWSGEVTGGCVLHPWILLGRRRESKRGPARALRTGPPVDAIDLESSLLSR